MKSKISIRNFIQLWLSRKSMVPVVLSICTFSAPTYSSDSPTVSINQGDYTIRTEILLPHLENNLHYTTTHTQQCLGRQGASTLFPILKHVSLKGCALVEKQSLEKNEEFDLVCTNAEAASGIAHFYIEKDTFRATLKVKMGGKNMKFSQRVYGRRIGDC